MLSEWDFLAWCVSAVLVAVLDRSHACLWKSRKGSTLVLSRKETSLNSTQPHTAYLAAGKWASAVADPAVMSRCRCFSSVSRATLMSARNARHTIYICTLVLGPILTITLLLTFASINSLL